MKKILLVPFLVICFTWLQAEPVKIIFDTDMESDVDDVAALAMLHALANRGEAEILATVSSSLNPWAAPTIDVVNTFYERPDIPIANVKTKGVYRNSRYARMLAETYPQDIGLGEGAQDATTLYREILNGQPDRSVVLLSVGYLTNLSYLLASPPDDISPLSGRELIKKKVKHYVCMGGRYPAQRNTGKWGNFKPDPEAVIHVAEEWPTPIIFTTGGDFARAIPTGKILFTNQVKEGNPITEAYRIFLEGWDRDYHHSADLIAVYVAVRGHKPYFTFRDNGYFHIFEDGTCTWRFLPDKENHFIVGEFADGADPLKVAADFDALLAQ
jgi:inosine-uridine nucleoside N-ribohydrolase